MCCATFINMKNKGVKDKKREYEELQHLENVVAKVEKRHRVEVAVLGMLAATTLVSVAVIAPNALQFLRNVCPEVVYPNQKQTIKRSISRMIQKGFLVKKDNKYSLSDKGLQHLHLLLLRFEREKKKNKKWDGKWRVVIFDVSEKRKGVRDMLRTHLSRVGFVKLQNSVWVYPYRCDEIIALLKFHLTLGRDAVYMVADALEGDEVLRAHFGIHT